MHTLSFRKFSGFGFWLNLVFFAILLGITGHASAQSQYPTVTPFTGGVNATDDTYSYGGLNPTIQLGNTPPGTLWDVTYTITNTTAYPLRFVWSNTGSRNVFLSPGMTLVTPSPSAQQDFTIPPGQPFDVTFQAGVPVGGTAVNGATANLYYNVSRVYDQVWNYDDFDYICGSLDTPGIVRASDPQANGNVTAGGKTGVTPDCAYRGDATFLNDLSGPITVYYEGYDDSGTIAPYISGTLCDQCGDNWVDGITLQPGESSGQFTMLVGMPWYIGNESQNTIGTFEFRWKIVAGSPPPPVASPSVPVPALGDVALALLVLIVAGLGARRTWRSAGP